MKAVDHAGLQGCAQPPAHEFRYRFANSDVAAFRVRLYFPKNIIVKRKSGSHWIYDAVWPYVMSSDGNIASS